MSFGPFPTPESSGYFIINLAAPSDESNFQFTLSGTPVNEGSATLQEFSDRIVELLDELHTALSPLGWTVNAIEVADMQRTFTPTEPE